MKNNSKLFLTPEGDGSQNGTTPITQGTGSNGAPAGPASPTQGTSDNGSVAP